MVNILIERMDYAVYADFCRMMHGNVESLNIVKVGSLIVLVIV